MTTNDTALERWENEGGRLAGARHTFLDRCRFRSREVQRMFAALTVRKYPACRITTSDDDRIVRAMD